MTEFKKAFVDTCVFIYYLERNPALCKPATEFFSHSYANFKKLITSAVTVEEYSVQPYKTGDRQLLLDFSRFLSDMEIEVINIDRINADYAARIRAEYSGFKPMDALQLAAAVQAGCDLFVTNDRQLRQFTGLRILLVEELG